MLRGDKSSYTGKQKRQVEHIQYHYRKSDVPEKIAESRAWVTVNKTASGGKKSGLGRAGPETTVPLKKGQNGGRGFRLADGSRAQRLG